MLQKSRVPQLQGIKAAAVVFYRKALITPQMLCHRLSQRVNKAAKIAVFSDLTEGDIRQRAVNEDKTFIETVFHKSCRVVYATMGLTLERKPRCLPVRARVYNSYPLLVPLSLSG